METVALLVLGLLPGLVLGYLSVMPRVLRLEKELAQALLQVSDSELEMVRVQQKAHLKESELRMALELAHSKAMGKE
jgi:predicted metal-binding transcription factor (methanogenesis marker protein 9)